MTNIAGAGMFTLRLLRAVQIEGQRWLRGAEMQADAATACVLIEVGTACLAVDADLPRLIQQIGITRPPG